jgi:hypothetical protein
MVRTFSAARLGSIVLLGAICFLTAGCGNKKVNKENFAQIKEGMTLEDVQDLLGKGGQPQGDGSMVAAQVGVDVGGGAGPRNPVVDYVWESGERKITVGIRNDKVVRKSSSGL